MASPQRVAVKLFSISPRALQVAERRQLLSPKTPARNTCKLNIENKDRLSPFNLDTPNRRKILKDGLPSKQCTVLGSGAFGTVYKASYKGNQVAAKVMETRKCTGVLNSEKHASLLRHSNIVKVLMIEQGACLSLITMELCGTTLQDRLDAVVLSKNERISILRDLTVALQFCHNADIVHADVKPRNILMSADGQAKLTDFGSSVLIGEPNATFEFHGTPGYTAPEVLKGNKPTPAADIYSLGIVGWQILSRQIPFTGLHSHTVIYLSAKGHRPKDDHINDEFKGAYKALYRKLWSQNVSERPNTNQVIREISIL
ncbi:Serine/threonine-protein kinase mos, partial [Dufourea novaeangliae]